MSQQFKGFVETSCFSANFPFNYVSETFMSESEQKKECMRKLSFRDTFDLPLDSIEDSGDFLIDFLSTRQRKMTNEMDIATISSRDVCLNFDLSFQNQEPQNLKEPPQQPPQLLNCSNNQHSLGTENYSRLANINNAAEIMEEEYEEPIGEQFESNCYPMNQMQEDNQVNNYLGNKKENLKGGLELQTVFGNIKQSNSPKSCLLKTSEADDDCFESPEPGKRYPNSVLATTMNLVNPDLRTITPQTLVALMNDQTQKYLIIDCRFGYEYKGGHIKGAVNLTTPDEIEELLIKNRQLVCKEDTLELIKADWQTAVNQARARPIFSLEDPIAQRPPILIFHCEFSQKRGPRGLRTLRNLDRTMNSMNWPNLFYPEVYILENGYKNFHSQFPDYCDPVHQYVRMVDQNYKSYYVEAKLKDRTVWKIKDNEEPTLKPTTLQRFKTMVCM